LESGLGKIASDTFFHRILYNSSKRKRPRKKKHQQEISGNNDKIMELFDSEYSRTHLN
jgi:hypothetical protein